MIVSSMDQFDKGHVQKYMEAFQKHAQLYQQLSAMNGARTQND
jgi:hypothetical protein